MRPKAVQIATPKNIPVLMSETEGIGPIGTGEPEDAPYSLRYNFISCT